MFSMSLALIAINNVRDCLPAANQQQFDIGVTSLSLSRGSFFLETLQFLTCEGEKKTTLVDLRAAAAPSAVRMRCLHMCNKHFWSLGLLVC